MSEHYLRPAPEIIKDWLTRHFKDKQHLAPVLQGYAGALSEAIAWGADQELEQCCYWLSTCHGHDIAYQLKVARRPQ